MAAGSDARVGIAKESVYGTRVAPARFLPLTAEANGFEPQRYFSPAIGIGRWGRPSIVTTKAGTGSISGDVPSTGFGYLLDGLHGATVTPARQESTDVYLQTHALATAPSKSFSVQVQMPPVTSAVLVPHDLLGVMFGGITLSWEPGGVLAYEIPTIVRDLQLDQSLAAYTPPEEYELFSFVGGGLKIGGSLEGNIVGSGSVAIAFNLRSDAYLLGSNGLMAKPVETEKPTATVSFTADFVDNTQIQRTLDNTVADVELKFTGSTIEDTYNHEIAVTLPDCVFTTNRAQVSGPGVVQDSVSATAASASGAPPVITYQSADSTL